MKGFTTNSLATLIKIFVLAAFFVAAVQSSADAAMRDLEIHNHTGYNITSLWLYPESYSDWGNGSTDVLRALGYSSLENGDYVTMRYDDSHEYWKLRIVLATGNQFTWTGGSKLGLSGAWKITIFKNSSGSFSVSKN